MTGPAEPPADLTAEQVRGVLELRGIAVPDEDLAAVTGLVASLRQQALGLSRAVRDGFAAGDPEGGTA